MKTKTSPFVFDEPSKVFDLASHFGGRRLRGTELEVKEVYKFPTREQLWKFANAASAFVTEDDCVLQITQRPETVTVEYK